MNSETGRGERGKEEKEDGDTPEGRRRGGMWRPRLEFLGGGSGGLSCPAAGGGRGRGSCFLASLVSFLIRRCWFFSGRRREGGGAGEEVRVSLPRSSRSWFGVAGSSPAAWGGVGGEEGQQARSWHGRSQFLSCRRAEGGEAPAGSRFRPVPVLVLLPLADVPVKLQLIFHTKVLYFFKYFHHTNLLRDIIFYFLDFIVNHIVILLNIKYSFSVTTF